MTTVTTDTTPYYYTVNNPTDPMAVHMTTIRQTDHLAWEQILPDEDSDFEHTVATLSISTGLTRNRVTQIILALYQLRDLPGLHALQHELFHLDTQRLIAICNALFGLNPDHLATVDDHLTDYLTPTTPNQVLPSARAISNKIAAIRDMLDDPRATNTTPGTKEVHISPNPDGTTDLQATLDPVDATLIDDAIRNHANATGQTAAEALVDLILGKATVTVDLHLYTASDLADAPVWAGGIGWLDSCTGEKWTARATRTHDMDKARDKHLNGHDPCHALKAAVKGRDGTCRFPGCTAKAINCDCDHRVNHEDGGGTCVHNLCSLCRHHHNDKTNDRITYFMDPITGIVIWLLADGTWAVTVPEGPLTPTGARWAQTVSQYRTKHRQRWAAAAKAEATEETTQTTGGQDDEPPF